MAHELDRKKDGTAATFSVGKTPWHKLGAVLTSAPSVSEALTLAGADFRVEKRRLYCEHEPGRADGSGLLGLVDQFATVRSDRSDVLGIVGAAYTPLQNNEAFGALEPLLQSGDALLETGGVLRGGEDVWILARFRMPSELENHPAIAQEVHPYCLIANNHTGHRGVLATITPIRVVCWNTLSMAQSQARRGLTRAFNVRHTATVQLRTEDAARSLYENVVARIKEAARQYSALKSQRLVSEQWSHLVLDAVAALPKIDRARATGAILKSLELAEERRSTLTWLWKNGRGHSGDSSGWDAYQAVTQAIDHNYGRLWPSRTLEARVKSLFDGHFADQKNKVLDNLLRASGYWNRGN